MSPEDRLRAICLALPEATEKEAWQHPTFRVRDKIFAIFSDDGDGKRVSMKAPAGVQEMLVTADPGRFFRPPYVGPKGWIGVALDAGSDWDEVATLARRSCLMTAPKRLTARLAG